MKVKESFQYDLLLIISVQMLICSTCCLKNFPFRFAAAATATAIEVQFG